MNTKNTDSEVQRANLLIELKEIKLLRKKSMKKHYKKTHSKLDRLRSEIVELRQLGASYKDIQIWLRKNKRLKVSVSTIWKRYEKWSKHHQTIFRDTYE